MRVTPDGRRYLAMGAGIPQPMPFRLRRGLPQLCRTSEDRWVVANVASMLYAVAGVGFLAWERGASIEAAVLASALLAGLPWVRFCYRCPILVDMPALALAVWAAVLVPYSPFAAGALVLFGAYVSERVPIWVAIFAWTPWPLLGLLVPAFNYLVAPRGVIFPNDPLRFTLEHPLRTGLLAHRGRWLSPRLMLLPWGAALVAVLEPSLWLLVAVAVGYAQMLLATDSVRLYQQAAPVVCVSAALAVPAESFWVAAPILLAWHVLNPWGGDGV